jgi:hypothetical protein
MLVLEVNEDREEGTDIVRVIDANPSVPKMARAPFQPGMLPIVRTAVIDDRELRTRGGS